MASPDLAEPLEAIDPAGVGCHQNLDAVPVLQNERMDAVKIAPDGPSCSLGWLFSYLWETRTPTCTLNPKPLPVGDSSHD